MRATFHYLSQARFFLFFSDLTLILIVGLNAYIIGLWIGFEDPSTGALTLSFGVSIIFVTRFLNRAVFEVDIQMVSV